jgi:hypothetical protein
VDGRELLRDFGAIEAVELHVFDAWQAPEFCQPRPQGVATMELV